MSSTQTKRKRQMERPDATGSSAVGEKAVKSHAVQPDDEEKRLEELLFGMQASTSERASSQRDSQLMPSKRKKQAAWADADDDEVQVDLAGSNRVRKLRKDHKETVVSGQEYQERARARLSAAGSSGAAPDWSLAPSQKRKPKPARPAARPADDDEDGAGSGSDDDGSVSDQEEQQDVDEVEQLLRSAGPLTTRSSALAPDVLGVSRLRDANVADPARAVLQDMGWHKDGAVLMTASLDARLRFFRVDGRKNPRLASVHLPDLPIVSAAWSGDGSEVIATGRRPFFYSYDVGAGQAHRIPQLLGRDEKSLESCVVSPAPPSSSTALLAFMGSGGNVLLAGAASKAWVGTLKMDGQARAGAFSRGPTGGAGGAGALDYPDLLTVGSSGVVYTWDLRTMKCRGKHEDEGRSAGTSIAAAPDGSRYAVGSASGVVNVYDAATALHMGSGAGSSSSLFAPTATPKPDHTLMHLTTGVSTLAWHPSGQGDILLAASQRGKDALRLMHGATGRVFSNWPTARTPLHHVTAAAFSPHGGYLTVGNDRGRVLLYRLHHYNKV